MGAIGNRLLKPKRKKDDDHKRLLPRARVYDEGLRVPPPDDGGSDMEMEVYKPQRKKIEARKKAKGRI